MNKKTLIISIICAVVVAAAGVISYFVFFRSDERDPEKMAEKFGGAMIDALASKDDAKIDSVETELTKYVDKLSPEKKELFDKKFDEVMELAE